MDILFASNNINKHTELQNIFKASECKHNLVLYSDIPEVLEDKLTIEDNATYITPPPSTLTIDFSQYEKTGEVTSDFNNYFNNIYGGYAR